MFAGIANCSGFQDIFYSLDNTSVLAGSGTLTGKGVFLTPQGSFVGSGTLDQQGLLLQTHEHRHVQVCTAGKTSESDILSWVCRCICGRPGRVLVPLQCFSHVPTNGLLCSASAAPASVPVTSNSRVTAASSPTPATRPPSRHSSVWARATSPSWEATSPAPAPRMGPLR